VPELTEESGKTISASENPKGRKRTLPVEFADMAGWHSNSYPACRHDDDKERADASIDAMARCC
jgi:hypothetical protein